MLVAFIIGRCVVAAMAVAGCIYLADHDKDGWGWLIVVALVAVPGFEQSSAEEEP